MIKKMLFSLLFLFSLSIPAQTTISETLNYDTAVKKIQINSEEIAYREEGSGDKVLLFIHGLSSNMEAWSKNIAKLKENYTSIAIDLPGYGKSSKNSNHYSMADYACFINEFIQQKELKNVSLVGHSMGGQVSLHTVLKHPENFEKLILIAPAGIEIFTPQEAGILKSSYTAEMVQNATEEQIRNNFKMNFYEFPANAEFMVRDRIAMKDASDFKEHSIIIVNNIAAMLDEPVLQDLNKIKMPVLMIFGNEDALIPNRYFHPTQDLLFLSKTAKEQLPQLEVKIIEKAGHFVNFEKAAEVNREIEDFMKQE
ncbi:pimeloyl-ACP methyl ester carboxylesterase [Gillisia mitskevichiae]|uniref:Pimeloyl-ACP methyl ester carboxylesterase n=1 Tax=Gillisia mitskevichiae TaxID=270921 RepID=A0A495PZG4_9FLAO|nr:alpha/beta hydrolase [Gillisia mitskevichiae]RKS55912.1 pimeloyl-ACP methyl ester carboxylesterase [Gillisia mitskevichiae]